ncbi:MAG: hypothetical protein CMF23_15635 [Ignavibacteriae bacterium]|nr:hypothetical protein [Ignavibacteriota bacterium]
MSNNFINKSTHIFLLLTLVSHLTLAHDLISEYVLCTGSDGHVAIENVNECEECSNIQFNGDTKLVVISIQDCEDVALDQNCFEDDEFIPQNKIVITASIVKFATIFENTDYEKKFNNSYIDQDFKNPILERYTSVSLLI